MYLFLDRFFLFFHSFLILFNLFGWIFRPLRKASLVTLILTGASWFILGIFYGIGYCPLTEWHWQVLHHLGTYDLPDSYVAYLAERLFGFQLSSTLADTLTAGFYFLALGLSVYINFFRKKNSKFYGRILRP